MKDLRDILIAQLKDLYSAETQLIAALPTVIKAAVNEELQVALKEHLGETTNQLKRLEKISKLIGEKLSGETCEAMEGLIKECSEVLEGNYENKNLLDVLIVAATQRIEHYEIAGYGNAIALADYLDLDEIAMLLEESIAEEGNADKILTEICSETLFDACGLSPEENESRTGL